MRLVTEKIVELIKSFESYSPMLYCCPAGYTTIGYGHLVLDTSNTRYITEEEAEKLLQQDISQACAAVLRNVKVPLNDDQYSALVSFTFNLGGAALQRSTLRQKVNNHEHKSAAKEFGRWIWGGGRVLPGLVKRRKLEAELYRGRLVI